MVKWLAVLSAGCFAPSPHRGQACETWCPPPEVCVAGECVMGDGGGMMPVDANYMFVTSTKKAPKDVGGFAGGDAWCNELAGAAGLEGTYLAWMSDDTNLMYAKARIAAKNARGWYRVDGKPFADTLDDVTDGIIYYPPRVTEAGVDIGDADDNLVATGTFSIGNDQGVGADCGGFTSDGDGIAGYADGGAVQWSEGAYYVPCAMPMHMYCFGITKRVPVSPPEPPADSKLAFVAPVTLGGGISGVDSACQMAASNAGISGTFKAWISTTTSAPGLPDGAWRRKDNVLAMTSSHELIAPIDRTLDGSSLALFVWTGSSSPTSVATPGDSCNDWTSGVSPDSGVLGAQGRSVLAHAWSGQRATCNDNNYVYCLEQ